MASATKKSATRYPASNVAKALVPKSLDKWQTILLEQAVGSLASFTGSILQVPMPVYEQVVTILDFFLFLLLFILLLLRHLLPLHSLLLLLLLLLS